MVGYTFIRQQVNSQWGKWPKSDLNPAVFAFLKKRQKAEAIQAMALLLPPSFTDELACFLSQEVHLGCRTSIAHLCTSFQPGLLNLTADESTAFCLLNVMSTI